MALGLSPQMTGSVTVSPSPSRIGGTVRLPIVWLSFSWIGLKARASPAGTRRMSASTVRRVARAAAPSGAILVSRSPAAGVAFINIRLG